MPSDERTSPPEAESATATAPVSTERWLLVGPDDETCRRLAARLGMAPGMDGGNRVVTIDAATAAAGESEHAAAAAACAAILAGAAGGMAAGSAAIQGAMATRRAPTPLGTGEAVASEARAAGPDTAAEAGTGSAAGAETEATSGFWTAVVYRPPRRRDAPALPDLVSTSAFLAAFAAYTRGIGAAREGEALGGGRGPMVPRLILVSSAAAVSPSHHHPGQAAESERPPGRNPIARAWLELESLAASCLDGTAAAGAGRAAELIVLRPAAVAAADGEDVLCRALRRRVSLVPAGYDPTVQLLSPDDLAAAVQCALLLGAGKPGIYHVAPAGAMPLRAALRLAGASRLPLGLLPGGGRLAYLRHGSTVSGARIERDLGFTPQATSAGAVAAELATLGRRGRRRAPAPAARDGGAVPTPPAGAAAALAGIAAAPGGRVPVGDTAAAPAGGAADYDAFGQDKGYIAAYGRTLFRFLHDSYWRIEHQGLEHVPRDGPAVLTGVHRGFMPWDGVMALHLIARELGRHPRFLIHPCLVKFPFLANYMTKLGGMLACQENADWVLARGELLGMFPEGIHGAFTMYRDAYRLGKFGRDEYVKMALRQGAPIVPFVTVGSAEIYPILGRIDSRLVRRVAEWPFLPLAPNFPLPGLPLPSKWHTRFLAPLPVGDLYPPAAADDPEIVRTISGEVRSRMTAAIQDMLARRRSIFRGTIFDQPESAAE